MKRLATVNTPPFNTTRTVVLTDDMPQGLLNFQMR